MHYPEEVEVRQIRGSHSEILEIKVSKGDIGPLIGKKGEDITAIRRIVATAGKGKTCMVELLGKRLYHRGWPDEDRGE